MRYTHLGNPSVPIQVIRTVLIGQLVSVIIDGLVISGIHVQWFIEKSGSRIGIAHG